MQFLHSDGNYVVVGLGASGLSAVRYLTKLGLTVKVCDEGSPKLADKLPSGVATSFGGLDETWLVSATGIVISPGVNPNHPAISQAKKAGVPIVSDIQLFADECHKQGIEMVAITGSNAKSTVTTLVGQMAQDAGVAVGVGGNLGTPALDLLDNKISLAVLELSSFQLEGVRDLGAKVATILNLSADHLDRHGTMQGYLDEKLKIFDKAQSAVLYGDDPALLMACEQRLASQPNQVGSVQVSANAPSVNAARGDDFGLVWQDEVLWLAQGQTLLVRADELYIKGQHNLTNALFALALGYQAGLPMTSMLTTLKAFKGLPHRCQYVKKVGNSDYFNDSKGTNVGATVAAIVGLGAVYGQGSLVVILGGQAKGQNFGELAPLLNRYGASVLTIGVDAPSIAQDLQNAGLAIELVACQTLDNAVKVANAQNAPCVLLSPACASFDQFTGFVNRGEVFVELVNQL